MELWVIDEPAGCGILGMEAMRAIRDDMAGRVDLSAEKLRHCGA